MSRRSVLGWQTSLADLSLVLFLVVAAAAGRHGTAPAKAAPSIQSEPLAVYAATPDAPPLADWLAGQAVDPRQQLTITARYGPEVEAQAKALAEAARLLADAKAQGRSARVVIEPGAGPARVALAYDAPILAPELTPELARRLLDKPDSNLAIHP